ncbi:MAG TPA: hypothetical protein VIU61_29645 [Kofleriaceae bacterium]
MAASPKPRPATSADVTPQQILQFMTSEHFAVQSAKSAIVAETTGRATVFLSSVSSAVVALAFVGQSSTAGDFFLLFGLALFVPLFFLGLATYVRIHEASIENMMHARRINRIRHYYVELAPEMAPYFARRTHDDMIDYLDELAIFVPKHPGRFWGRWEQMITIAGAVAVVNAVIAGVVIGMLCRNVLGLAVGWLIAIGALVGIVVVALHSRYGDRRSRAAEQHFETMFPNKKR